MKTFDIKGSQPKRTCMVEQFDSLAELSRVLEDRLPDARRREEAGQIMQSDDACSPQWCEHSKDWARGIMQQGGYAPELAERIRQLDAVAATSAGETTNVDFQRDLAGVLPCVPTALSGHPMAMFNQVEEPRPSEVLRLVVCTICSAGVSGEAMARRGQAILAAVDSLEKRGTRIELVAVWPAFSFDDNVKEALLEVVIKRASEDYNAAAVAYAISDVAMGRRTGFEWLESRKEFKRLCDSSYGHGSGLENLGRYADGKTVVLGYPTDNKHWRTQEQADNNIKTAIAQIAGNQH